MVLRSITGPTSCNTLPAQALPKIYTISLPTHARHKSALLRADLLVAFPFLGFFRYRCLKTSLPILLQLTRIRLHGCKLCGTVLLLLLVTAASPPLMR